MNAEERRNIKTLKRRRDFLLKKLAEHNALHNNSEGSCNRTRAEVKALSWITKKVEDDYDN